MYVPQKLLLLDTCHQHISVCVWKSYYLSGFPFISSLSSHSVVPFCPVLLPCPFRHVWPCSACCRSQTVGLSVLLSAYLACFHSLLAQWYLADSFPDVHLSPSPCRYPIQAGKRGAREERFSDALLPRLKNNLVSCATG